MIALLVSLGVAVLLIVIGPRLESQTRAAPTATMPPPLPSPRGQSAASILGVIIFGCLALGFFFVALSLGAFVVGKIAALQQFGETRTNSWGNVGIGVVLALVPAAAGVGMLVLAARFSRRRPVGS